MRKKVSVVLFLAIWLLAFTSVYASGRISEVERPQYVEGEVLVKLKPGVSPDKINGINRRFLTRTLRHFALTDVYHLGLPSSLSVAQAIQVLQRESSVAYAVPNNLYYLDVIPNDSSFGSLWGMNNTGQSGGTPDADIDAPEAWDIETGDSNIVIAVIDSGLDLDHPDIAANLWVNPGEIANNGIDDDGNGYIDDVNGWDFASDDNNPSASNDACVAHGTHTAGTIGAVGNNGVGVTGVNWNVQIMPIRAFRPILGTLCSANDADLIASIEYHTLMGAPISSNSWGGTSYSQPTFEAIRASNSVFVAAAGNGNLIGVGQNNDTNPHYPSSYALNNIISVAATDHNDNKASFSNYGLSSVDLGAPGVNILSTVLDSYGNLSGTSMATPHVAGVAGLLLAQDPNLTINEVIWRILNSVDDTGLQVRTGGRLNSHGALAWGLSSMPVTVDAVPVGPTTVRVGDVVNIEINSTNNDTSSHNVVGTVYARLEDGRQFVLASVPGTLSPAQTYSVTFSRQVPPALSPGATFRVFVQVQDTNVSFDEDWIEYTVIP